MSDEPSQRLVAQRVRNRLIETLEMLSEGDRFFDDEEWCTFARYFNWFYDWSPYQDLEETKPLQTLSDEELRGYLVVRRLMDEACDTTPSDLSESDFISTGWPEKISISAQAALDIFLERGRFSEEVEQESPGVSLKNLKVTYRF